MANAHVNLNFNAFLEKTKLKDDGSNYSDWVQNLRIILIAAHPREPRRYERLAVTCWWLLPHSVWHALQLRTGAPKRFEQHWAYEMFEELKMVFQAHARVERYEVSNKFYSCKMEENSSVSEHILKMSGLHNHLSQLDINLPDEAVIDRIL